MLLESILPHQNNTPIINHYTPSILPSKRYPINTPVLTAMLSANVDNIIRNLYNNLLTTLFLCWQHFPEVVGKDQKSVDNAVDGPLGWASRFGNTFPQHFCHPAWLPIFSTSIISKAALTSDTNNMRQLILTPLKVSQTCVRIFTCQKTQCYCKFFWDRLFCYLYQFLQLHIRLQ